jgi:hypothetical protein
VGELKNIAISGKFNSSVSQDVSLLINGKAYEGYISHEQIRKSSFEECYRNDPRVVESPKFCRRA